MEKETALKILRERHDKALSYSPRSLCSPRRQGERTRHVEGQPVGVRV